MPPGAHMVHLGRQELDVWLGEPDDFVLAVLRDLFETDADIRLWLNTPRHPFGGWCAADLISMGRAGEVEALLIEQWNAQ